MSRTPAVQRAASGSALLAASLALRFEVFVQEQGVPADLELDAFDHMATTRHLVIAESSAASSAESGTDSSALADPVRVLATVRWITEPAGYEGSNPSWGPLAHLQRLAVRVEARGRGLGAALVRAVQEDAQAARLRGVVLAAQLDAIAFYERLGYLAHGPVFDDAGLPHRWMTRALGAAGTT